MAYYRVVPWRLCAGGKTLQTLRLPDELNKSTSWTKNVSQEALTS